MSHISQSFGFGTNSIAVEDNKKYTNAAADLTKTNLSSSTLYAILRMLYFLTAADVASYGEIEPRRSYSSTQSFFNVIIIWTLGTLAMSQNKRPKDIKGQYKDLCCIYCIEHNCAVRVSWFLGSVLAYHVAYRTTIYEIEK